MNWLDIGTSVEIQAENCEVQERRVAIRLILLIKHTQIVWLNLKYT